MEPKRYAGGFLFSPKKQAVLLHLRDGRTNVNPNKWAFFGGLSEGDETPVQTFLREIKEELNVSLRESNVIALREYLNEELQTWRSVFYAVSDLELKDMRLSEGAGFDWIPIEEVFTKDLTKKTEQDLRYFFIQTRI